MLEILFNLWYFIKYKNAEIWDLIFIFQEFSFLLG